MVGDIRNDFIKRSSQMMLQGWRLLAISCPICNSPLLSKGEIIHCAACDMPVKIDNSMEEMSSGKSDVKEEIISEDKELELDEEDDYDDIDIPSSFEELKKEYDAKRKQKDASSAKLGDRLLRGWVMLAQVCPRESCFGIPLMKNPETSTISCVGCEQEYTIDAYGTVQSVKGSAPMIAPEKTAFISKQAILPQSNPSGLDMNDAPILSFSSFESKNDASMKISKKLMKGWALLDRCCSLPTCLGQGSVPLLRDLLGQEFCVECGYINAPAVVPPPAPVVAPTPAPQIKQVEILPSKFKPSSIDYSNYRKRRADSDEEDDDDDDEDEICSDRNYFKPTPSCVDKLSTKTIKTSVTTVSTTTSSMDLNTVQNNAIQVLKLKLVKATEDLDQTESITESVKLTQYIYQLSEALNSLSKA